MRDYFETQRFILRRFSDGDEEALYELLSDEDVTRFLPMFCLKDINEAKQYLKTYQNQKGLDLHVTCRCIIRIGR